MISNKYRKVNCLNCGHEMATLAKRWKCYKCGKRRYKEITKWIDKKIIIRNPWKERKLPPQNFPRVLNRLK
jgi:ribosomal protein S27AE